MKTGQASACLSQVSRPSGLFGPLILSNIQHGKNLKNKENQEKSLKPRSLLAKSGDLAALTKIKISTLGVEQIGKRSDLSICSNRSFDHLIQICGLDLYGP
jgi:hypothetical protein